MGSMGAPRTSAGFAPRVGAPVRAGAPVGSVNRFAGAPVGVTRTVGVTRVSPSGAVIVTNRFHGFHHGHNHVFFRSCFGFPCTSPFLFSTGFGFGTGFGWGWGAPYAPYYYPDSSYYPYEPNYAAPPATSGDNSADVQLAMEVQRLSDEIEDLRKEQGQSQERASNQPPGTVSMSVQPPTTATTFVFRDGHRVSAINYAIAGQTLWIFSENMAKKVSLDDLDHAATEQVNAANGIYLYLPKATSPH
jgi:hypothetical protein